MKKKNHITFAGIFVVSFIIISGLLGFNLFEITVSSVFAIAIITLFYSLLPDIDHKNSTITWWFFGVGILGLVISVLELVFNFGIVNPILFIVLSTLLLAFTYVSVVVFKHRGVIHSVPVGILSVIPLFFVFHSFAYCLIGYVAWHSHLIGDGYLFKIK